MIAHNATECYPICSLFHKYTWKIRKLGSKWDYDRSLVKNRILDNRSPPPQRLPDGILLLVIVQNPRGLHSDRSIKWRHPYSLKVS